MKWLLSKHKLLLRRSRYDHEQVSSALPAGHFKVDASSGQMFTEKTISTVSSEERNWTRPRRVSRKSTGITQTQPIKGVRSLQNAAIETIIENMMDLTFEGVDCLPRKLVLRIWDLANERYVIPFCVWTIFSKVLQEEDNTTISLLRYRDMITSPRLTLQNYTAALTSPNFEFLTYLSLTTAFPVSQLVKLSSVKNLGILEIVYTRGDSAQSGVTDRLVRAWHQTAVDNAAFPVLRILKLWNHKNLTEKSLTYLNSFPALAVFDVRGCKFDTGSRALGRTLGWRSTLDVGLLNFFEAMCVERAVVKRASTEEHPKPIRRAPCHQLWNHTMVSRIPRAEVTTFLTRPQKSISRKGPDAIKHYELWQEIGDMAAQKEAPATFKEVRWEICNQPFFNTGYQFETWEFLTYTTFSRIGELRSDLDLQRAGVNIGEQAIVNEELTNSVPMACVRLGPYLDSLDPSIYNNPVKSFYGSAYTEDSHPHLTEHTRIYPKPEKSSYPKFLPRNAPDPANIAFYRINVPRPGADSPSPESVKDEAKKAENGDPNPKRNSFADFGKRHSKFIQNKKQKLGDVLGSFM
ncbi:hypothetical protein BKA61DRAFT_567997 [Leptodontidium sp. MPI-SDFR-AT-0119]|nr:hypothetical protein BKA61DRAFT_567997 [Leptodontidium sp. MPI-SDFR-AT-0119]